MIINNIFYRSTLFAKHLIESTVMIKSKMVGQKRERREKRKKISD